MSIRRISTAVLLLAGFPLFSAGAYQRNGRKYTPPPATATIKVTVLRSTNGKPIPNAAVVFHPMEGERDKGALELKSNEDGIVTIDVGQGNRWIGWATADQTLRVLAGETPVEEENIPVRVWTEENASEATGPNDEDGYGESFVAGYEKLWGVGG